MSVNGDRTYGIESDAGKSPGTSPAKSSGHVNRNGQGIGSENGSENGSGNGGANGSRAGGAGRTGASRAAAEAQELTNIGALFRRVRKARDVPQDVLARYVGIKPSSLSRFESKGAHFQNHDFDGDEAPTFELCVDALRQHTISGHPVTAPLSAQDAEFLIELYRLGRSRQQIARLEEAYSFVSTSTIVEARATNHLRGLHELKQALARESRPAFIADSLWHIHALNGATINFFGIVPPSTGQARHHGAYLGDWTAWHVIGSKFAKDSPVRSAHLLYNTYFPPTVNAFFQTLGPWVFTMQARAIVRRLIETSLRNGLEFQSWWSNATALKLAFAPESMYRLINFRDAREPSAEPIVVHAAADSKESRMVPVVPDESMQVEFWMGTWNSVGDSASQALIRNLPGYASPTELFFPGDYDVHDNFFVNTWPDVAESIPDMAPAGR